MQHGSARDSDFDQRMIVRQAGLDKLEVIDLDGRKVDQLPRDGQLRGRRLRLDPDELVLSNGNSAQMLEEVQMEVFPAANQVPEIWSVVSFNSAVENSLDNSPELPIADTFQARRFLLLDKDGDMLVLDLPKLRVGDLTLDVRLTSGVDLLGAQEGTDVLGAVDDRAGGGDHVEVRIEGWRREARGGTKNLMAPPSRNKG